MYIHVYHLNVYQFEKFKIEKKEVQIAVKTLGLDDKWLVDYIV